MRYWLIKSEPGEYAWDDLENAGEDIWDGVRNYKARNNMREMKLGDQLLFYRSVKKPAVVGLAEVSKESFPDPADDEGRWSAVMVKAKEKFPREVSLKEIKSESMLSDMELIRISRLSISEVKREEFDHIVALANKVD